MTLVIRASTNHDIERVGNYYKGKELETIWALNFFLPGVTFVYAGDEYGEDVRQTLFEIEEINWNKKNCNLTNLFKILSEIKKDEIYKEGFFGYDVIDDLAILKYLYKDKISYGIFNFGKPTTIKLDLPNGKYSNKINEKDVEIKNGEIEVVDFIIL